MTFLPSMHEINIVLDSCWSGCPVFPVAQCIYININWIECWVLLLIQEDQTCGKDYCTDKDMLTVFQPKEFFFYWTSFMKTVSSQCSSQHSDFWHCDLKPFIFPHTHINNINKWNFKLFVCHFHFGFKQHFSKLTLT